MTTISLLCFSPRRGPITWNTHSRTPNLRLLTAPVQTALADSTCDLRRGLVVSTLKFTPQLAADRLLALPMVDGGAPDDSDEYAYFLSDLLAEFASSVRVSQSVGDAEALLAAQNLAQLQTTVAIRQRTFLRTTVKAPALASKAVWMLMPATISFSAMTGAHTFTSPSRRSLELIEKLLYSTVYPVYPVPASILNLMWDFGNPCNHIW